MITSRLRTSTLTNSSTSATRVMVKYNEVDRGRSGVISKLVKKSRQKVKEMSKSPQNLKSLKNLQKSLIGTNVYQSTNLLSIRYKELQLLFEL